MTKIKIDNELIGDVIHIWRKFRTDLSSESDIGDRDKARTAGYLTIAYMFGAQREDDDGLKCELCGYRPCILFGPEPKKCSRCGGDMVERIEVKEVTKKDYDEIAKKVREEIEKEKD